MRSQVPMMGRECRGNEYLHRRKMDSSHLPNLQRRRLIPFRGLRTVLNRTASPSSRILRCGILISLVASPSPISTPNVDTPPASPVIRTQRHKAPADRGATPPTTPIYCLQVLSPVSQPPRATRDNVSYNRICDCDKLCISGAATRQSCFFTLCHRRITLFSTSRRDQRLQVRKSRQLAKRSKPSGPAPRSIPRHRFRKNAATTRGLLGAIGRAWSDVSVRSSAAF